jgi:hypothetical protein
VAELKLASAWRQRIKLRAEGNKLWAEGNKLWAEGNKLRAEGNKLWAEAIIETYGNITLSWSWRTDDGECRLENGDVYSTETVAEQAAA